MSALIGTSWSREEMEGKIYVYLYACVASVKACGKTRVFTHTSADYSNILNKIKIHTCSTPASALISTLLGEPLITAGFSSMSPAHPVEIGEGDGLWGEWHCFVVRLRNSNQTISSSRFKHILSKLTLPLADSPAK